MKNKNGFTYIELIITFVLLIIISVSAVIIMGDIKKSKIINAAKKISEDLRYAQTLSMSTGRRSGAVFSVANNSYMIFENSSTIDPAVDPLTRQDFIVQFNTTGTYTAAYSGITISNVSFNGSPIVSFNTFGTPLYGDGTLQLTTTGNITLNSTVTVLVQPQTGAIEIQQ